MDWVYVVIIALWMGAVLSKLTDISQSLYEINIFCNSYSITFDDMHKTISGIDDKIESFPHYAGCELEKCNSGLRSIETKLIDLEYKLESIYGEINAVKLNTQRHIPDDF